MRCVIHTKYYVDIYNGAGFSYSLTLVNNEAIHNDKSDSEDLLRKMFENKERQPYKIKWIDEFDRDYGKGFNARIFIGDFKNYFYLKLTPIEIIKIKCIQKEYWLLRGENFKTYIYPAITWFVGTVMGYIIGYITHSNP